MKYLHKILAIFTLSAPYGLRKSAWFSANLAENHALFKTNFTE
jgi:hypothetical protein